ncbi:hypothetical protein C7445_11810 [Alicyclobacillus sacchari]|uniref:Uncharacterized protein n=2 Tax=Alicyclobacillus sacchari TaxID=392010 RepID=A0A4R8LIA6_9BACL|nr:hypothetical protein C7445_11810 [Alicyclobacillus sacchari]
MSGLDDGHTKEGSEMPQTLAEKISNFNQSNFDALWAKAQKLERDENGVLLLDRDNPLHREWYEEEDC